jgi:NAD-dependent dihydropyrimidine dehydrogenase PreA subunit
MQDFRYLSNVATIKLDEDKCIGCRACTQVCPHGVFSMNGKKVHLVDRDGCMECGACALNCPVEAITVTPGVGCAAYIIQTWIKGKGKGSCGGETACC